MNRWAGAASFAGALVAWQLLAMLTKVPAYLVPTPFGVAVAFASDVPGFLGALLATLSVTGAALLAACVLGVALAVAMRASHWANAALAPWTVIAQVTPVVAVAPLIIVWIGDPFAAMVVCATVVAFFPVFSNTAVGLAATPPELLDVFRLSGASRWQEIAWLRFPAAVPYFLAGLRVSGGLALVGAVVAEFVTGAGGVASGLAYRILESSYRLQTARMFAALALLSAAGLAIHGVLGLLSRRVLARYE